MLGTGLKRSSGRMVRHCLHCKSTPTSANKGIKRQSKW